MAAFIGDDVYDTLDMDIWKESMNFIAKQCRVTNRKTVVFKIHTVLNLPPSNGFHANQRFLMMASTMMTAPVVHIVAIFCSIFT